MRLVAVVCFGILAIGGAAPYFGKRTSHRRTSINSRLLSASRVGGRMATLQK